LSIIYLAPVPEVSGNNLQIPAEPVQKIEKLGFAVVLLSLYPLPNRTKKYINTPA
jgi:hypothetical protein